MTNFPSSLDDSTTIPAESANTKLSTNHVTAHQNIQDAIEAIEAKVGANSSAVTTSHDYKLSTITGSNKAVSNNGGTLTSPIINLGSDAEGDTYYRNSSGALTRLARGTDNYIYKMNGNVPNWEAETTNANASTTVAGLVELATSSQVTSGTATGETGAALVVTPDALAASTPVFNASGLTDLPLNIYTTSTSANLKLSADTERSDNVGVMVKVKEVILNYGGVVSCGFDAKCVTSGTRSARIYVNGTAVGTDRASFPTSYTTYTEDINVNAGDRIQLYIKGAGGETTYVRNFRIYYDKTITNEGLVVTN